MTPADFIAKWGNSQLRERQGSQEHFIDLCRLLGEPTPGEDDPLGDHYCFERGAEKVGGGDGWADVWRKHCFGWEYKGKHKDLNAALRQLQAYALDLQNPPYLVVSDMERIVVHTNWTNTISRKIEFTLDDLHEPQKLEVLRLVFQGSEGLKPGVSPQELTAKVAVRFGELGRRLQERGHAPREVAHFLNRLVFCMFAEDARLLPDGLFAKVIRATQTRPEFAQAQLQELFSKMRTGGFFGAEVIKWFNGGLFDDAEALPLTAPDLKLIGDTAAEHDWSQIDPAIFGTLFEQALHTTRERPALGAHYTDREKILKIVDPVIVWPLAAEWDGVHRQIAEAMEEVKAAEKARKAVLEKAADAMRDDPAAAKASEPARRKQMTAIAKRRDAAHGRAQELLDGFRFRLSQFRVLDPACGSGNFLYVALHALHDIELRAQMDAERLGLPQRTPLVGLDCVRGIEIEAYAAELARVTLWIGDLQWLRKNGYTGWNEPILSTLDQIENRDALLNPDGTEAVWPEADVIIGNPPFLGGKRMRAQLGDDYVERLFETYRGRVPAEADFVTYWVEKAWRHVGPPCEGYQFGGGRRAGLVTTNSIRGGANRRVLEPIAQAHAIREAWADEAWVVEGAAVRVSMIGFGWGMAEQRLDGRGVDQINPDLTASDADLTQAQRLLANRNVAFQGPVLIGPFQVDSERARLWLCAPSNPNGRRNADVLRPISNASDIVQRSSGRWVVDFLRMTETDASLYEQPYKYALAHIKPDRIKNRRAWRAEQWWRHGETGEGWRESTRNLSRYILTPRVAKHRVFVWCAPSVFPDSATIAVARDDSTTFGILHSRFHEIWSLRLGTWLGVGNDPRYTPSTTFETFPFPEGLTPDVPAADYADDPRAQAIAAAAEDLNRLREAWLNPPDLVDVVPEVVAGYPDRILPKDEAAAAVLKKRTLTNLYNERPAWLDMAHRRLDEAVAAAYGWPADLADEEVLERLFSLNQERAAGR